MERVGKVSDARLGLSWLHVPLGLWHGGVGAMELHIIGNAEILLCEVKDVAA